MAAAGIAVHLAMRLSSDNLQHWADVPLYVTLLGESVGIAMESNQDWDESASERI